MTPLRRTASAKKAAAPAPPASCASLRAFRSWYGADDDSLTVNSSLGPVKVDRSDVNLTDLQPVVRYRVSPVTHIAFAPNLRYSWETDQASIPLGFGGDTLIKLGKLPVKVGFEAYYDVESDDDPRQDWQLRFLFFPVLPPRWSGPRSSDAIWTDGCTPRHQVTLSHRALGRHEGHFVAPDDVSVTVARSQWLILLT